MIQSLLVIIVVICWISYLGVVLFNRWKLLDKPWPDKPKRKWVPTLQGIIILLAVLICTLLFRSGDFTFSFENPYLWLRIGIFIIVGVTSIDELWRLVHQRFRISAGVRLLVQVVVACISLLVSGVGIDEFLVPGGVLIEFWPFSTVVFTVWWFLLFINAINWFDGLYGLASGISSIGFLSIWLLIWLVVIPIYTGMSPERYALLSGVSWYAMTFFIATLVAAFIEFRPRGVMRDVGTMTFGFVLWYLALLGGAKIWTMVVVLMLPLFDAMWVIIDRIHRRKGNPLQGDYTHLHFRLLALWWNRTEARVTIWWVTGVMMILMLLQWDDRIWKILIFLLAACIFFGVNRYLFWKKWLSSAYDVGSIQDDT